MVKRNQTAPVGAEQDVAEQVTSATDTCTPEQEQTPQPTSSADTTAAPTRATTSIEILDWDEVETEFAPSTSGTQQAGAQAPAGADSVPHGDTATAPHHGAQDWSLELDLTGLETEEALTVSAASAPLTAQTAAAHRAQVTQLAQRQVRQVLGRELPVYARALGTQRPVAAPTIKLHTGRYLMANYDPEKYRDTPHAQSMAKLAEQMRATLRAVAAHKEDTSAAIGNWEIDTVAENSAAQTTTAPHRLTAAGLSFLPRKGGLTPKSTPRERKVGVEILAANPDAATWGIELPQASDPFSCHQAELARAETAQLWNAHAYDLLHDEVHNLLQPAQYVVAKVTPSQQQQRCAQWLAYLAPLAAQARADYALQHGLDAEDVELARAGDLFPRVPWTAVLDEYDEQLGLYPVAQLREQLGLSHNPQAPRLRYREMVRLQESHLEFTFQAYNKFRHAWEAPLPQPQHYGINIPGGIATEYYSSYYFALQQLQADIYLEYWKLLSELLSQHQASHQQLICNGWLMHEKPVLTSETEMQLAQAAGLNPDYYRTWEQVQESFAAQIRQPLPVYEDWSRAVTHVVSYRARVAFPAAQFRISTGWQVRAPLFNQYDVQLRPRLGAFTSSAAEASASEVTSEVTHELRAWTGLPSTHGLRSFSYLLATDVLAQGWRQLSSLSQLPQTLHCAPAFKLVIDPKQIPQLQWCVTRPQHWLAQLHARDAEVAHSGVGVELEQLRGAVYGRASLNFSPFRTENNLSRERDLAYFAQAVHNATTDVVWATRKWLTARQQASLSARQVQLETLCTQLESRTQGRSLGMDDGESQLSPADLPNLRHTLGLHEVREQAVREYQENAAQLADLSLDVASSWQAPGRSLAELRQAQLQSRGSSGLLQRVLQQRAQRGEELLPVQAHSVSYQSGVERDLHSSVQAGDVWVSGSQEAGSQGEVAQGVHAQTALPATSVQNLAPYFLSMENWHQEVVGCKPLSEFLTISTNLSMLEIHTHFTENIPQQVGRDMTVIQAQDKGLFFTIDDPTKLAPAQGNAPTLDPEYQQLLFAPRVIRVRGQQFYDDVLWCNSRRRMYPININREFFKTLANNVELHQLEMAFQTLHYLQGKTAQVAMTQVRAREKCYTMYGPRYMAISRYHAAIRYIQYKATTDTNSKYKLSDNHPRVNQIAERELRVGMKFADVVYQAAGNIDAALVQKLLADQEPISDDLAADIALGIKYEFERHVLCSIDADFTKVVSQARYTSAVLLAQYQASARAQQHMEGNTNHDFVAVPVPERLVAVQDRYRVPRSLSVTQQQQLPWSYRLLFRLAMGSGYFDQHREVDYYLENRRELNHLMRTAVPEVQVFQRLQSHNVWQIPSVIMRYILTRVNARYENIQLLESRLLRKELAPTGGDVFERPRDRLELILPNPAQQRVFVPNLQVIMSVPLVSYHLIVCRDQVASLRAYKDHLLYTYYHHLRPWYKFTAQ